MSYIIDPRDMINYKMNEQGGNMIRSKLMKFNKVTCGATVTLLNIKNANVVTYKIVGENEADPTCGTISIKAPVAHALIGRSEGQSVKVKNPRETIRYKICKIKYGC
jgi:transcription elongation factor GreA